MQPDFQPTTPTEAPEKPIAWLPTDLRSRGLVQQANAAAMLLAWLEDGKMQTAEHKAQISTLKTEVRRLRTYLGAIKDVGAGQQAAHDLAAAALRIKSMVRA